MKFALIQPTNRTATIRIIDGQFAVTTILGRVAFASSPSAAWEFLIGTAGWEPLEEKNVRNKQYSALATKDNEDFTRLVYRVPEDVDLYTVEELRGLLPIVLDPGKPLDHFCPKI